jgi:serine/threonine protein kinase
MSEIDELFSIVIRLDDSSRKALLSSLKEEQRVQLLAMLEPDKSTEQSAVSEGGSPSDAGDSEPMVTGRRTSPSRIDGVETDELVTTYVVADAEGWLTTLAGTVSGNRNRPHAGLTLNNRYRLIREIGSGGMGTVYFGQDQRLERDVAVKVIHAKHWEVVGGHQRADMRAMFEREARIGAGLSHSAIAAVYDFGFEGESPYAVFEFVDGPSLKEIIQSRAPLPLLEVQQVLQRLAEVLDYAHDRGIVHRDLKPDNIRFDSHGDVKILDLGLAMDFQRQSDCRYAGTPAYSAPEQAAELPIDGRTDQYALALIVFEMLSGRRVFHADSLEEMLEHHRSSPPPPLSNLISGLDPGIESAIANALSKNPADRFGTCGEFALAVGACFEFRPSNSLRIDYESQATGAAESFQFSGRKPAYIALVDDRMWIADRDAIDAIPLHALSRVSRWRSRITLHYQLDGRSQRRKLKLPSRSVAEDVAARLRTASRQGGDALPSEVTRSFPPPLVAGRPASRLQLLSRSETTSPRLESAELSLQVRAAIVGADAMIDVQRTRTVDQRHWQCAGTAARTLDVAGRTKVAAAWYEPQIQRLCRRSFIVVAAFVILESLSIAARQSMTIATRGEIPTAQSAVWTFCMPLAKYLLALGGLVGLKLKKIPELLRPVGVLLLGIVLCEVAARLTWLVAASHSETPTRQLLAILVSFADPVTIGLIVSLSTFAIAYFRLWKRLDGLQLMTSERLAQQLFTAAIIGVLLSTVIATASAAMGISTGVRGSRGQATRGAASINEVARCEPV